MELLAPAGSPDAVKAAVQAGADAIYLGYGSFNARRRAKNFTQEELETAVKYCHARGVKVFMTLNTLVTDREMEELAGIAAMANDIGIDAAIVQDLGVAKMLRQTVPELPIHASTQMTVCNLEGVIECARLGFSRVILSRELSRDEIAYICKFSPIEIEVFVHGALCMCYSGQCFFSSLIGTRSGNRGMCAQPCRLKYGFERGAGTSPLSLKDLSLVNYLEDLERIGVTCLKIEGRMKRPEYVGIVTQIYADAIREKRVPSAEEMRSLEQAFSRGGFTDGYFTNHLGPEMFGVHDNEHEPKQLYEWAKKRYIDGDDLQKVPIEAYAMLTHGKNAQLAVRDRNGHTVTVEGPVPEDAINFAISRERVEEQISRTGGTQFTVVKVGAIVEDGLTMPISEINAMRRNALEQLAELRFPKMKVRPKFEYVSAPTGQNPTEGPTYTVSLRSFSQLSEDLIALNPYYIALPLDELFDHIEQLPALLEKEVRLVAILPRVPTTKECDTMKSKLLELKAVGITETLVGNLGSGYVARDCGMIMRGDFGIGYFNSLTSMEMRRMGYVSATASFEMRFPQIRDLRKALPTEAIVYGRLPLMITKNCIMKNGGRCPCEGSESIIDRKGARFPVLKAEGCRNEILNSKILFLADLTRDYARIGLTYARLMFTTETAEECVQIMSDYITGDYSMPNDFTRGLYYRAVE